jgi:hypothetical protein
MKLLLLFLSINARELNMKYIKHINPIAYNLIIDGKDPK